MAKPTQRRRRNRENQTASVLSSPRETLGSLREALADSREAFKSYMSKPKPPLEQLAEAVEQARLEVIDCDREIASLHSELTNKKGQRNAAAANHQTFRAKFAEASLLPNKVV